MRSPAHLDLALLVVGMARFRSTVFVLDYAHFESVMSLQSYCQSDFASFVLDLTMTGLLLLLRSVACIESTFLIFGLSCLDLTLLVLDSSLIDLLMSLAKLPTS